MLEEQPKGKGKKGKDKGKERHIRTPAFPVIVTGLFIVQVWGGWHRAGATSVLMLLQNSHTPKNHKLYIPKALLLRWSFNYWCIFLGSLMQSAVVLGSIIVDSMAGNWHEICRIAVFQALAASRTEHAEKELL